MPKKSHLVRVCLVAVLVIPLTACFGGKGDSDSRSSVFLQVSVSPASLSVPAGGGGYVTVTASRPQLLFPGNQGALALSLDQAPTGVTASGTILAGATTGLLSLWVDGSVSPQTLQGLRVKATSGSAVATAAFNLTIAAPLPVGQIRVDGVQASGGKQVGGTMVNSPFVQEPVTATPAKDAAQTEAVRSGFHPVVPSN